MDLCKKALVVLEDLEDYNSGKASEKRSLPWVLRSSTAGKVIVGDKDSLTTMTRLKQQTSKVGVHVYTLQSKATQRRLNILDDIGVNDKVVETANEDEIWVEKTVDKPKTVARKTTVMSSKRRSSNKFNNSVIDHGVLPWKMRSRSDLPWVLRSSVSKVVSYKVHDGNKTQPSKASPCVTSAKRPKRKVQKEDQKCPVKITTNEPLKPKDKQNQNSTRSLKELDPNVSNFKNNQPQLPNSIPEIKIKTMQPIIKLTAINTEAMNKRQSRRKRTAPTNDAADDSSKENDSKPVKIARRGTKRFKAQLKEYLDRTTTGGSDDFLATTPNQNRIAKLPIIPHIDSPIILDDVEDIAKFGGASTPRSEFTCPTPERTPVYYRSHLTPLVSAAVGRLPVRSNKLKVKSSSFKMTNKKAAKDRKWKKALQKLIVKQLSEMKKSEEKCRIIDDDDDDDNHLDEEYDE